MTLPAGDVPGAARAAPFRASRPAAGTIGRSRRGGPAPRRACVRFRAAVAAALAAASSACGLLGAAELPFTAAGGERVALRAERRPRAQAAAARAAGVAAAAIAPQHGILATARFKLAAPVRLLAGEALVLVLTSQLDEFTVELYDVAGRVQRSAAVQVGGSGELRYRLAIDQPLELSGLQLRAPAGATAGHLELRSAAVTRRDGALLARDGTLLAGGGFVPRTGAYFDGTALWPVDLELAPWNYPHGAAQEGRDGLPWLLVVGLRNAAAADFRELRVVLEAGATRRAFLVTLRPGRQLLHLHGGDIGFRPRRMLLQQVEPGAPHTGLVTAAVEALPAAQPAAELMALPADLGTALRLAPARWRRPEFELYAWNGIRTRQRAPVLVFDTADYATQARFFRRLAFYVEKRGYRGRLLSSRELQGLRGYNAHDYAAPDLARFFSQAQAAALPLTDEELLLRAVALTHGIIEPDPAGGWRAGEGAILSISQASGRQLRRLLLRHEALHGLYFTHPAYQEAARELWQELTAGERLYWHLLLDAVGYDIEYEWLVVNEFQAYLLQQEVARVENLLTLWAGRLRARHPHHERVIDAVAAAGERWRTLHRRMAAALAATTGVRSSALTLLRVADD